MSNERFFRFSTQTVLKAPSKLLLKIQNQHRTKKKRQDLPTFSDPIPISPNSEIMKMLRPIGLDDFVSADKSVHSDNESTYILDDMKKHLAEEKSPEKSLVSNKETFSNGSSHDSEKEAQNNLVPFEPPTSTVIRTSLDQSLAESGVDLWVILNEENESFPLLSPKSSAVTTDFLSIPSKSDLRAKYPTTCVAGAEIKILKSGITDITRDESNCDAKDLSKLSAESQTVPAPVPQQTISPVNSHTQASTNTHTVVFKKSQDDTSSNSETKFGPNEVMLASPEFQSSVDAFWYLQGILGPPQQDDTTKKMPSSRNFSLEIGRKTHSGKSGSEGRNSGNMFVFDEVSLSKRNHSEIAPTAQKKRDRILEKLSFDGSSVDNDKSTSRASESYKNEEAPSKNDPEMNENGIPKPRVLKRSNSSNSAPKSNEYYPDETSSQLIDGPENRENSNPLIPPRPAKLDLQNIQQEFSKKTTQPPVTTPRKDSNTGDTSKDTTKERLASSVKKWTGEKPRASEAVIRPNPLKNTGSIRDIAGFQSPTSPRGPGYQPGYISGGTIRTSTANDRDSSHNSTVLRNPQRKSTAAISSKKGRSSHQPKIRKSERINRPLPDTPFLKEEGLIANLGGAKHEAILAHRRQLSDEIDLDPGDILKVFEVFEDGWCLARISEPKNTTERRNRIGACPRCCLRELS